VRFTAQWAERVPATGLLGAARPESLRRSAPEAEGIAQRLERYTGIDEQARRDALMRLHA
jgi:hypothetical protein